MAKSLAKILAIIGGLIVTIFAVISILRLLSITIDFPWFTIWGYDLGGWINPIIALVVGILILIATGVVKSSSSNVRFNGVTVLILGILAFVFGDNLGAILVIIGGILLLI